MPACADEQQQTGERDERRHPPEEDELLAARVVDMPRDEVTYVRGIEGDLVERASSRLCRLLDHRLPHDHAAGDRRDRAGAGAEPETVVASSAERVAEEERTRAERPVH